MLLRQCNAKCKFGKVCSGLKVNEPNISQIFQFFSTTVSKTEYLLLSCYIFLLKTYFSPLNYLIHHPIIKWAIAPSEVLFVSKQSLNFILKLAFYRWRPVSS